MRYLTFTVLLVTLIFTTLLCEGRGVQANQVSVTAMGCERYTELTPTVKDKAERVAKEAAWKKFIASSLTRSQTSLYKQDKRKFLEELDNMISGFSIQKEKDDTERQKYCVLMSVAFNQSMVEQMFVDSSASGTQDIDEASDFGVLFVARVETSRKTYDTKRTDVSKTRENAVLKEESSSSDTSSVDAHESETLSVEESGGSSTRKRDKVEYEVSIEISEDLGSAIEEQLNEAGFAAMDVEDLEDVPFLDELAEEGGFRASGGLPSRVKKGFKNAAIDAGWEFLGLGSVDISAPMDDTRTGQLKVTAKVNFKVWKLSDGRAKTTASVKKQIISVVGDDASVLETAAANKAAKKALDTVISQMQKKGLR